MSSMGLGSSSSSFSSSSSSSSSSGGSSSSSSVFTSSSSSSSSSSSTSLASMSKGTQIFVAIVVLTTWSIVSLSLTKSAINYEPGARLWLHFLSQEKLTTYIQGPEKNGSQVARILFLLLLTTSAWPCLKNSCNLGTILLPGPVHVDYPFWTFFSVQRIKSHNSKPKFSLLNCLPDEVDVGAARGRGVHEAGRVAEADKVEDGAVLVVGHAGRLVRPHSPRSNQQRKHRRKRFPLHFPLSILFFFHVQLGKTNTHHHISSSGDGNGEGERDDDKSPHDGGTTDVPSGGVTSRTADASRPPSFPPLYHAISTFQHCEP